RLKRHPDARRLEVTYVDVERPLAPGLRVARGRVREVGRLTAVARTEIHSRPIVLAGSPAMVPAPTRAELDAEMAWNLDVYWRRQRARLDHFLFAPWIDFAVTTLARILWTLRFGTITSKPEAARWLPDAVPA